jgi:hypothetical protein
MRLTDSLIQFDTLYLDGETAPRVMAIAVHNADALSCLGWALQARGRARGD